ncbi:MAG: ABC transporter permease [Acidimicrobiales bacterium]|nr:ABC transporter permease [Acidimicrobiales bacterium]
MLTEVWLVAAKDLLVERRSRVALTQIAPFAVLVLVLFGLALGSNSNATLREISPALYWVTVLFAAILAIQRSFSVDQASGVPDALRLSGLTPAAIFLGKALAIVLQLLVLQVVLVAGIVVLFNASIEDVVLLVLAALAAVIGIAAAGTLYGVLASDLAVRDSLLPLLLLPVLAPVLMAATRTFDDALGLVAVDGWAWLGVLGLFGVIYLVFGALAYGVLLEES